MNLTQNVSFAARDDDLGGIECIKDRGPKFGKIELVIYPYGKEA
jgi:hypothetical protein